MNDSQPRPRETSQIKRVREVSIVLRDVAETLRVTDRPKKLKPLVEVLVNGSTRSGSRIQGNIPNADHD